MILPAWLTRRWRRKYYLVRQYDRMDCGPAALLSVLRYWGGDAPFSEIRETAGTDVSGTPFIGLLRAAAKVGFQPRGVSGTYEALIGEKCPCIAHLILEDGTHHYLVCERVDEGGVMTGDPMEGRRWMPREEFELLWKTRALILLEPGDCLRADPPPPWPVWFAPYLLKEPIWFVQSLYLGGVGTLLGIATALFIQHLIDRLIPSGAGESLIVAALVLGFVLLLRAGTDHLRQRFLIRLSRVVSTRLNHDFISHLLRLPARFFETRVTGDVTARLSDGMRIQKAVIDGAASLMIDTTLVVGALTFLLATSPHLGLLAAATIPLYVAATASTTRKLAKENGAVMAGYAKVEALYLDSLASIEAITGYGVAPSFAATNQAHFEQFQEQVETLQTRASRLNLLVDIFGAGIATCTLAGGALLVIQGDLLIGELVAGYTLVAATLPSVERMVRSIVALQEASIAAGRLRDLLLTPAERWEEGDSLSRIETLAVDLGRVVWANGSQPFEEVTFCLERGELVGLIGANGAGKSTIMRILTRALPLSGGSLLVNGTPAASLSLSDYRTKVLILPNEVQIISGSLGDNVLFGRPLPDMDTLDSLVSRLDLGRFLERFRNGWAEKVGEGGRRLSAGERQVVGLMRALLFPPDVLLVDEGIGSTDEGHTALVLRTLRNFSRERIVLIVSHDPRVHCAVDRILHFRSGKLVSESVGQVDRSPLSSPPGTLFPADLRSRHVAP